jgi:hypothetical protein
MEWAAQKKMFLEKTTQIVGYSPLLYNIYVKLCLNHGPQEPEIYIAKFPGEQHGKIKFNENKLSRGLQVGKQEILFCMLFISFALDVD